MNSFNWNYAQFHPKNQTLTSHTVWPNDTSETRPENGGLCGSRDRSDVHRAALLFKDTQRQQGKWIYLTEIMLNFTPKNQTLIKLLNFLIQCDKHYLEVLSNTSASYNLIWEMYIHSQLATGNLADSAFVKCVSLW